MNTFRMGSTLMVVGLSNAIDFVPPANCNGGFFKIQSGAGTLYLASSYSQIVGATMYSVGATEIVQFEGPARFFLGAAGATMVVSVGLKFSSYQGITQSPIAGG